MCCYAVATINLAMPLLDDATINHAVPLRCVALPLLRFTIRCYAFAFVAFATHCSTKPSLMEALRGYALALRYCATPGYAFAK